MGKSEEYRQPPGSEIVSVAKVDMELLGNIGEWQWLFGSMPDTVVALRTFYFEYMHNCLASTARFHIQEDLDQHVIAWEVFPL